MHPYQEFVVKLALERTPETYMDFVHVPRMQEFASAAFHSWMQDFLDEEQRIIDEDICINPPCDEFARVRYHGKVWSLGLRYSNGLPRKIPT